MARWRIIVGSLAVLGLTSCQGATPGKSRPSAASHTPAVSTRLVSHPSPRRSGRSTRSRPPRTSHPAIRTLTPLPGASHARRVRSGGLSTLPGSLLIADKENNRLLLVGRKKIVKWIFPRPGDLAPGQQFLIPDDAFFTPGRRTILATEEDYHVIREIDRRTRHIIWQYGHPGVPGFGPGYLNGPDDAYRLQNGLTSVADIRNCRVLFIRHDGRIDHQWGRPGACWHDPPSALDAPNGDTPLPDGGTLISEIGGSWIDRLDAHGHVVWAFQSPLAYPSDPQLLPDGHILVCDYSLPGRVLELDTHGHVAASFGSTSAPNLLNHPSLAIQLPNGLVALNDDWNHRVIVVDLHAQRIVWQYGVTGYYGSAPGYLDTPDGIDFLPKAP